jgi:hypothetical protein
VCSNSGEALYHDAKTIRGLVAENCAHQAYAKNCPTRINFLHLINYGDRAAADLEMRQNRLQISKSVPTIFFSMNANTAAATEHT